PRVAELVPLVPPGAEIVARVEPVDREVGDRREENRPLGALLEARVQGPALPLLAGTAPLVLAHASLPHSAWAHHAEVLQRRNLSGFRRGVKKRGRRQNSGSTRPKLPSFSRYTTLTR